MRAAVPLLVIACVGVAWQPASLDAQRPPSFQHEVRPIFEKACFQCHSDEKSLAGLDVRSIAALMAGGSGGPALIPGKPDDSLLIKQLESGKMPLGGEPLTPAQLQLVRAWVKDGRFPRWMPRSTRRARQRSPMRSATTGRFSPRANRRRRTRRAAIGCAHRSTLSFCDASRARDGAWDRMPTAQF